MQDTIQRVWILENDNKNAETLVGHTKAYVKVLVKKREDMDLLGRQVIVKVTSTHKWHIVGDIIEYNPQPVPVDEDYFEKCLKKREEEAKQKKIQIEFETNQNETNIVQDKLPQNTHIDRKYEVAFGLGLIAIGGLILYNKLTQ